MTMNKRGQKTPKKAKMDYSNTTLHEIIKSQANSDVSFSELDNLSRGMVLRFIAENHIDIKVFSKKWYDVLADKFYASEYVFDEDLPFGIGVERRTFDTFDQLFDYTRGDVYENSCFYGYTFSKYDVERNRLILKSINTESFIDETIDLYIFEAIAKRKHEEISTAICKSKRMAEWFQNCGSIHNLARLEEKYQQFQEQFFMFRSRDIFASFVLRQDKNAIKDATIKFASEHDIFEGINFYRILLNYGTEAARAVADTFAPVDCSERTIKKRIKSFRRILESFENGEFQTKRKTVFDAELQLYVIRDTYYVAGGGFVNCEYFSSFDELVVFLNGDLCGVDFSEAHISQKEILKFKVDSETKMPRFGKVKTYFVDKKYKNGQFIVEQKWLNEDDLIIFDSKHSFEFFFDFVHFLKGDLSNADFLMCKGIEKIKKLTAIRIDGIKVKSEAARELGLPVSAFPLSCIPAANFKTSEKYELKTIDEFAIKRPENFDYAGRISYITDIHLLHRFAANKCEALEDVEYVTRSIIESIGEQSSSINLIGGDTCSDFGLFKDFANKLKPYCSDKEYFFVLGNHELWGLHEEGLPEIVKKYRGVLSDTSPRLHLIQNSIFYADTDWKEISEQELSTISVDELKKRTRKSRVTIFGGIGFSGFNDQFNANSGIYRGVLNREEEKNESRKFLELYKKVVKVFQGRNLVILTHMPMKDWGGPNLTPEPGVIYVSGHDHNNYFYDDGATRIYADNQIGYQGKKLSLKKISLNFGYDWFADYSDGIYEISKEDYETFYRGINETLSFGWPYESLHMVKRDKNYMFFMKAPPKGNLMMLAGGQRKGTNGHSLEYYYENLSNYSQSIKMFLSEYNNFEKQLSASIKKIGGRGTIHGCIVDIDFFNHLYINPLDGTITPYHATSIVDKDVYENVRSLLKCERPELYKNYKKLIESESTDNMLVELGANLPISRRTYYYGDTDIYRYSRIIKGFQFTTGCNVVRLWNDDFVSNASEENGRLIVSGVLEPSLNPKPAKATRRKQKEDKQIEQKIVLSQEQKEALRSDNYKEKIKTTTEGKISCLAYRGSQSGADYLCNICGYKWSMRPDKFKDRCNYLCPKCKADK